MKVYHTLKPIYNKNSKILILGTMPSVKSRAINFYYAHPSNRFWSVIEQVFSVELRTNNQKKEFVLNNNIALWDVIYSCDIQSSSDSSIKNIVVNDLNQLIANSNIVLILFTGLKAYDIYKKNFNLNLDTICLPSPSSANAKYHIDDLVKEYRIIKTKLSNIN